MPTKLKRFGQLCLNLSLNACALMIVIVAALTFAGYFGNLYWLFDIAGIFRVQYAILLLLGAVISFFARRWCTLSVAVLALSANLLTILPLYLPHTDKAEGKSIRILQMNVWSSNREFMLALTQIKELAPDVVCFEEIDEAWQKVLTEYLTDYPYRCVRAQTDNFGIAVFSKLPLEDVRIIPLGTAGVPSITAIVRAGDKSFRLMSVHVLPPISERYFTARGEGLETIADFLDGEKLPVVLAGDLNTPPWSYYFKKLCDEAKLVDSEIGFGVQPTWPTNPEVLLNPIDHLLTRGKIAVKNRFVTGFIGSDHYPVCVDLVLSGH